MFLFLAWAVDGGLLPALSSHASRQANPTEKTMGCVSTFWILWPHRKKQYSPTPRATWYLQSTVMRHTSPNQKPAVVLVATCSWPERMKSLSTMELSSTFINNLGCHVICGRSRIGCPIYQCKNCRVHVTNAHQTWPLTATHTNANRQCNSTHTTYQQNITQSPQSHGNALLLAMMPQHPRSILVLLETGHSELGRLLHKASPSHTPQDCTSYNTHSCQ